MLVDFKVENYRSYREEKTLSMVASTAEGHESNLVEVPKYSLRLLKSAVLYGPNASGKSNLLVAMHALAQLLQRPLFRYVESYRDVRAFALSPEWASRPTTFAVKFIVSDNLYEYVLAVQAGEVVTERLVAFPNRKPQIWFTREHNDVQFSRTHIKGEKQSLLKMTPPRLPLLAVAESFGHPQLSPPASWIAENLCERSSAANPRRAIENTARRCDEDEDFRSWMNLFLARADLGIKGVEIEISEMERPDPPPTNISAKVFEQAVQVLIRPSYTPFFIHEGARDSRSRFGLKDESLGTQRLFWMLAPFYDALKNGSVMIIDEMTASLHPSLVRELIQMFHNSEGNPRNAQLIFTTHDSSLLGADLFRRDQVWFTEKAPNGATDLYSLHDVKGVREGDAFEKGYLRGRYGAIPFFREFDFPPPVAEGQGEART